MQDHPYAQAERRGLRDFFTGILLEMVANETAKWSRIQDDDKPTGIVSPAKTRS